MKGYAGIVCWTAAAVLCCHTGRAAELLGSSNPEIKKNFNRLITTNACPHCNLSEAVLNRVDLAGADLEGAKLSRAKMNLASLVKANLRNADLQGAELGGADLAGADLRGANLTGAHLGGAYLAGALLDKGQLAPEQKAEEPPAQPTSSVPNIFSPPNQTAAWPGQQQSVPAQQAFPVRPLPKRLIEEVPVLDISALMREIEAARIKATAEHQQNAERSQPAPVNKTEEQKNADPVVPAMKPQSDVPAGKPKLFAEQS